MTLWNPNNTKADVSDSSHPMHIFSLSILESSKQCISAIENDKNTEIHINDLQTKLKECGIIYLLYRTVINKAYNEEITELLQEQKEIIAEIDEEVTSVK